jgi:hypothetical protein
VCYARLLRSVIQVVRVDATTETEAAVPLQMSAVMLGVGDLARSKKFYAEGLGCAIEKDFPKFVSLSLGDGAPYLAIYEREAAAEDAGVSAEGSGFTGISFHYTVGSHEAVDEVMSSAVAAGSGYFSDPDGYLWKVACPS